jgi:hypothetical protein
MAAFFISVVDLFAGPPLLFLSQLFFWAAIAFIAAFVGVAMAIVLSPFHERITQIFQASVDTTEAQNNESLKSQIYASTILNLSYFTLLYFIGPENLLGLLPYGGLLQPLHIGTIQGVVSDITSYFVVIMFGGAVGPVAIQLIRLSRYRSDSIEGSRIVTTILRSFQALFYLSIVVLVFVFRSILADAVGVYEEPFPSSAFHFTNCWMFLVLFLVFVFPSTLWCTTIMERWFSVLKRGRSMQFRVKSKIVKIGGSGRPVVPTEIAETLKVKPGDEVEFVAAKGYVVIKKAKQ